MAEMEPYNYGEYMQYNETYNQSGYPAPTNSTEYYGSYNSNPQQPPPPHQTSAGSNNASSTGQPSQTLQQSQSPSVPQQQATQTTGVQQGYSSNPRNEAYDAGGYPATGYYNYSAPATSGNYQTGPTPPVAGGGASSSVPPPSSYQTSNYNNVPPSNKTSYDRANDYGEISGSQGYGNSKNPYGDNFGGGGYKSRENVRDSGYGLPSKENASYESYGTRGGSSDGYKDYNAESTVQTSTDTIYISNLNKEVTEEKLAEFFGGLGKIKIDKRTQKPKIWIYYDKVTKLPKGDATLTYEDPDSTAAAIKWFHNKEFLGQLIKVEMSVRKVSPSFANRGRSSRPRGRGFSGSRSSDRGAPAGGRGGPPPREGDWTCDSCSANNFARRTECYKCHTSRADAPGDSGHGSRYGGSPRGGYRGRRGGGPSYGGSGRHGGDEERGYGGSGYRNDSYGDGYSQGYGRSGKQDDRRDNSRYRPY